MPGDAGGAGAAAGNRNRDRGCARCGDDARHSAWKICACSISVPAPERCCWPCSANCRTPPGPAPTSAPRRSPSRAPSPQRHRLDSRCTFVACDIASGVDGPFDFILSNPPYVARGDIASLPRRWRPSTQGRRSTAATTGSIATAPLPPRRPALARTTRQADRRTGRSGRTIPVALCLPRHELGRHSPTARIWPA